MRKAISTFKAMMFGNYSTDSTYVKGVGAGEEPTDLLGIGLHYSFTTRMEEDPKFRQYIDDLELKMVVDLGYYPLLINFKKNSFQITRNIEKPDVTLKVDLQSMIDMTEGRSSMIGLFLKRKLKIKPIYKF